MNAGLRKCVLKTLAYFDIFDHPLTREELFRYLLSGYPDNPDSQIIYSDFLIQLEHLEHLEHKDSLPGPSIRRVNSAERSQGFYFLPGRESIVETRQRRVKIIEEKMRLAVRGIKKLRWVPFVRAVFVCNTVAMGFVDEDSDIDVFIVVKKGRIWLVRLSATLILSLFRLRRTKTKIKNKICLSFYTTNDNLDLSRIAIEQPDTYLIYWIASLIPVYDPENLHQSLLEVNKWVAKYLPNLAQAYVGVNCCSPTQKIKKFFERMWGGRYGDMIEAQTKAIQQFKMKMNYSSRQNDGTTAVVVSDEMLKFHENDRRMEYRQQWLDKCRKYLISNI